MSSQREADHAEDAEGGASECGKVQGGDAGELVGVVMDVVLHHDLHAEAREPYLADLAASVAAVRGDTQTKAKIEATY